MATTDTLSPARTKEMIALLRALSASAQTVIDAWSQGDLAGAVNAMESDMIDAAEFLEWIDSH